MPVPGLLSHDPWPGSVAPAVTDVDIAIARTFPEWEGRSEVREVERLLVDLLNSARRCIYIETQYFTSKILAAVLAARLQEPEGPDVVMILHPNSDGWLEQHTMDVLRGRVLKHLRAADRFGRLGLYYPHLPDLNSQCISMHSKVCVIDLEYVRIGSANLSNRSMGFDSRDILTLFFTQGAILGIVGGVTGLLVGFGICSWLETLPSLASPMGKAGGNLQVSFAPRIYGYGLSLALFSSAFASILPARAAGRMTPIDIIRSGAE